MTVDSGGMSGRIALVVPSLTAGGAQRVMAELGNHWVETGWKVRLITIGSQRDDFFALRDEIDRVGLDLSGESRGIVHAITANRRRIRALRSAIGEWSPDLVVSFVDQANVLTLLACRSLRTPVIVAERTDPRHHAAGRPWDLLRRGVYPWAAAVVVQTESVRRHVAARWPRWPVHVIENAAPDPGPASIASSVSPEESRDDIGRPRYIVGLGRLSPEKGFDRLIAAFHQFAERFPQWRLVIHGDGPERGRLVALAEAGGNDRVRVDNWAADLDALFRMTDIFVLPSRYEGFPNALLEAMAYGVACVSFACESGPAEIIRHEVDGLLVDPDDVAGLAGALERLMSDPADRQRLAVKAREIVRRFSREAIFKKWDRLLAEACRPDPD